MMLSAVVRLLVFTALWWVVSEGRLAYALYGIPSVLLATAASLWLMPPTPRRGNYPRRFLALLALVGYCLGRICVGGVDVARRAVSRPLRIDPVVIEVPLLLPQGLAQSVALAILNLLPGSLVQRQGEHQAELHVLASDMDAAGEWEQLQARVAAVADLKLEAG